MISQGGGHCSRAPFNGAGTVVKKRQRNPPNQQPYFDLIAEEPEIPDFMKIPSEDPESDFHSDSDNSESDSDSDISLIMSENDSEDEDEPPLNAADFLEVIEGEE